MSNQTCMLPTSYKTLSLGVALMLCAHAHDVMARERMTQFAGPGGAVSTRQVQRSAGDVNSSTTGPRGQTVSRSVDRSAAGSTATVTGPNGQSATRSTSVTRGTTTGNVDGGTTSTAP